MSALPLERDDYRIEDLPEDQAWPRQEIIDGSLYVSPYAKLDHQRLVGRLYFALQAVVPPDLEVFPGGNVFRRSETDRLLIPDVLVLERDSEAVRTGSLSAAPEDVFLAAEVISRSSRAMDLHTKRELYAEWKVGSYWVVDPGARRVHRFGDRSIEGGWLAHVDLDGLWPEPPKGP